ncbi:MAG: hypothetical protein Q9187_003990 [Circinaria calcarea]
MFLLPLSTSFRVQGVGHWQRRNGRETRKPNEAAMVAKDLEIVVLRALVVIVPPPTSEPAEGRDVSNFQRPLDVPPEFDLISELDAAVIENIEENRRFVALVESQRGSPPTTGCQIEGGEGGFGGAGKVRSDGERIGSYKNLAKSWNSGNHGIEA